MKTKTLIVFAFLSLGGVLNSSIYAQAVLYVYAPSGLNLRETPNGSGKILANVPYGESVEFLDFTEKSVSIDDLKGHWNLVKYKGKKGYLFSGYLGNLPAPARGMSRNEDAYYGLAWYASKKLKQIDKTEENVDGIAKTLYKFIQPVELETNQTETAYFEIMTIKNIPLDKVVIFTKLCYVDNLDEVTIVENQPEKVVMQVPEVVELKVEKIANNVVQIKAIYFQK